MAQKVKKSFKTAFSNRNLRIGFVMLICLILVAIFAEQIGGSDPKTIYNEVLAAPGEAGHLLGTDGLGRDLFALLIHGSRTSLLIGFVAASISAVVGTLLGGLSGYFGGKLDAVVNEIMNMFMMTPTFFLILIIIALFGSSIINVMVVIGLTGSRQGTMDHLCDICIKAPAEETYQVQEYHLPIYHAICRYVEEKMFAGE